MSNRRREDPLEGWVPKTQLGKLVMDGQVSSIYEVFEEGYKIKEVQIVDALVPNLKDEVININLDDVKEGNIPDIELLPGDRIHIPETWL